MDVDSTPAAARNQSTPLIHDDSLEYELTLPAVFGNYLRRYLVGLSSISPCSGRYKTRLEPNQSSGILPSFPILISFSSSASRFQ